MDFIAQNYLWIILFVIVILMAIVGYIAEKNGFIANAERPKQKYKNNEKPVMIADKGIDELLDSPVEEEVNIIPEATEVQETIKEEKTKEKKKSKSKKSKKEKEVVSDIETPSMEETVYDNVMPSFDNDLTGQDLIINNPVMDSNVNDTISDDIMSPLVDTTSEDSGVIDEALFAPLEPTEMVNNEDSVVELNPVEITPLQEIDNESVVNEQEDIWKF